MEWSLTKDQVAALVEIQLHWREQYFKAPSDYHKKLFLGFHTLIDEILMSPSGMTEIKTVIKTFQETDNTHLNQFANQLKEV